MGLEDSPPYKSTVKLIHFSDIHLTARPLGWRPRDLVTKRVSGWANVKLLGRGKSFRHAPAAVRALVADIAERRPDGLVFSGDATGMGFASEVLVAAKALGVGEGELPAVAVPGNHDAYTRRAVREGVFEQAFGPWLHGLRVDAEVYPFARQVGHVWLIGVNSSTHNRWLTDASGAVGAAQLDRLERLCAKLPAGTRVLVTHYPLRTADGLVEPRQHRLRDHAAMLEVSKRCGVGLWLHGHIHKRFVLTPTPGIPFPVVCAGSATQHHRWSYAEYDIQGREVRGTWRRFEPELGGYGDDGAFTLTMPG